MSEVDKVKQATALAAKLREESYNRTHNYYALYYDDAALMACQRVGLDAGYARLISVALNGWWNDALDWANTRAADRRYVRAVPARTVPYYLRQH